MLRAEMSLPRDPRSAGDARRLLASTLQAWDCAELDVAAGLLLTELVTNAILHAQTGVVVRVTRLPDGLRLEVVDGSPQVPTQRYYSDDATTGRGLRLVASIASRWGVSPEESGKVVWCEVTGAPQETEVEPDLDAFLGEDDVDLAEMRAADADWASTQQPVIEERGRAA